MLRILQLTKNFASKKIDFNAVNFEDFGGFGKLVLNRPEGLNALS
jgi:hypothetical protein